MNPQNPREVYIVDGSRTPFLKAGGAPGPFTPVDLAVWAGRPLMLRQSFAADAIDEVILGCVNPHYTELNPGRVAALRLGCGAATPGWTVQRNCGSGMQSLDSGCRAIAADRAELVLAGGTEALSHAPVLLPEDTVAWLARWNRSGTLERVRLLTQIKPAFLSPVIGLAHGLTDPICGLGMGQTAEVLRYRFSIARTDADRYALRNHQRLAAAQSEGYLDEIEPMFSPGGGCHHSDEGLRPDSTLEQLAARSVWATRWGPAARASCCTWPAYCSARTRATASPASVSAAGSSWRWPVISGSRVRTASWASPKCNWACTRGWGARRA